MAYSSAICLKRFMRLQAQYMRIVAWNRERMFAIRSFSLYLRARARASRRARRGARARERTPARYSAA